MEKIVFLIILPEEMNILMQKNKNSPNLTPLQKLSRNGLEDFDVWPETINFLEENMGRNFLNADPGNDFF